IERHIATPVGKQVVRPGERNVLKHSASRVAILNSINVALAIGVKYTRVELRSARVDPSDRKGEITAKGHRRRTCRSDGQGRRTDDGTESGSNRGKPCGY